MSPPRVGQLVVVGRTRDSVARTVFAPLQDPSLFGPMADHEHYIPSAPTAWGLNRTVYVLSASDSKADKVLRATCAGGRVRQRGHRRGRAVFRTAPRPDGCPCPGAQLFGTSNPASPAPWDKHRYLDRLDQLPDWRSFEFNSTVTSH